MSADGVPSAITRPACSTTMRSARPSASSMSCVIITVVRRELVMQAPVVLAQAIARQRVERGERLVHEDDRRVRPPEHARRRRAGARRPRAGAESACDSWDRAGRGPSSSSTRAALRAIVPAQQPRRDGDVLGHRHMREQADLLKHVADAAPQRDRIERVRIDRRRSRTRPDGRLGQAIDELQQRGLAGAGRADDDQEFARLDTSGRRRRAPARRHRSAW